MNSDAPPIRLRVKFFAAPREALGKNEIEIQLPPGSTVEDMMKHLTETYPVLRTYTRFVSVAVNRTYVSMDTELHEGDEVACLPPVGGG